MRYDIFPEAKQATLAAADYLVSELGRARSVMVAGGNTPLELYAEIERRRVFLPEIHLFILDEYVGVPPEDPRTCSNLLGRTVQRAWRVNASRFYTISSLEAEAERSVMRHERHVEEIGGLDVIVLGLGPNGHLGFNEPGSSPASSARVLDLKPESIEANRKWFGGEYAPSKGATVGLRTILGARHVILLAFGEAKTKAAHAMMNGPKDGNCPAAFLQSHPSVRIFLDEKAAAQLEQRPRE